MLDRFQDSADSTMADPSSAILSPSHSYQGTGYVANKNASNPKLKREKTSLSQEDPAMVAAHTARMKNEFYLLEEEWRKYPRSARPKTRREELQMLPRLCSDFKSFDEQMAYLDSTVQDPGLLSRIRDFMNERMASLEQEKEEVERKKRWEVVSRTMESMKEILQYDDTHIKQRGEEIRQLSRDVREHGQDLTEDRQIGQYLAHRVDDLAYEVHESGLSFAPPRRRFRHLGGAGRNTH
ncbi:hypothetical protein DENSPDRAFT_162771 [Dentipellis sp. KUC8613]|nr:hypothetical protein DENSPDRAFT_162771 [Dentipellis sp. KUC8613]